MTLKRKATASIFSAFFVALLLFFPFQQQGKAASRGALPDFVSLAEESRGTVVNIAVIREERVRFGRGGAPFDFFEEFFRDFRRGNPDTEPPRIPRMPPRSQGSGFIISADGYILTNHHVVDQAQEVLVRFADRRELPAEIVGTDERSDLALLKVDARNLPTVRIGSSEELKVGEWVAAIGNPFGFELSVTQGIVSATGRSLPSGNENYVPFIQTDVAINPGNSGGPLFNLEGEVVGINSQIYTRTGSYAGVSFAIPIDVAMENVEQLKESGHVVRGFLGVTIQNLTNDLAESFSLDRPIGALVSNIIEDSPADEAGVKVGDIILEFNGQEIETSSDLPHIVGRIAPGRKASMLILREGKRRTLRVEIGELPNVPLSPAVGGETAARLGMEVAELTSEEIRTLEADGHDDGGVRVVRIEDGAAADAGIRPGDLLLSLDRKPIDSVEELSDAVEDLPPGRVPVLIYRNGSTLFLSMRVPTS